MQNIQIQKFQNCRKNLIPTKFNQRFFVNKLLLNIQIVVNCNSSSTRGIGRVMAVVRSCYSSCQHIILIVYVFRNVQNSFIGNYLLFDCSVRFFVFSKHCNRPSLMLFYSSNEDKLLFKILSTICYLENQDQKTLYFDFNQLSLKDTLSAKKEVAIQKAIFGYNL